MFEILIFCFFSNFSGLTQESNSLDLDCIKISDIEYLVQIRNNTNKTIFIPATPRVSFQGDSMYASISMPYKNSRCTFYTYIIDGKSIKTDHPLKSVSSPDSVYEEYVGGIPNFSVPSSLIEIKSNESYHVNIFGRGCVNPKTLTLEFETNNSNNTIKERKSNSQLFRKCISDVSKY